MKKLIVASLSMAALALGTASPVFATASVTTLATTNMSADTAGTGGTGAYTTLIGPVLTEGANQDISSTGAITLNAPTGFQFNSSATVSATVTRVSGTGTPVTLSAPTGTVTSGSITITVTAPDTGATLSSITWSGIQVRPTAGTPPASGNITKQSGGAGITGITSGTTSFGTLTEIPGAPAKLAFTTQPTNITAGVTMGSFVVQVQDQFTNVVAQSGTSVTLTLNGSTLFSGTDPQTTAANGKATFNDFVIRQAGNGLSFTTANNAGLANTNSANFNILPAAASAYRLSAATTTPQAGVADLLTIQLVDQYQNIVTNFTGTKSLTFSGLSAGADGTLPTVTDNTGAAKNFGTATTITFSNGVSAIGGNLVAHNPQGPVNLAATDGTLSTATTGGTTVSLTVSVGNASAYRLSAASTNIAAGVSDALTIKLVDQYQNVVTTFSSDKNLTFSGLSASTNGTQPTVTDKTGTPVNLGTPTTITFASGLSSVGGTLVAYKAQGPVALAATDGSLSTATLGGTNVSLTVSAIAQSAFRLSAASATPTAGATDALTITAVDPYGNTVTTYTGSHGLTFSGLGNAPAGNVPTVAGVNLGSATSVTFANGQNSGTVNLIAFKEETTALAVTDGTFSTAGTGGASASLTVNSAVASAYRLSAATTTPTVGVADQLTISLVDQYQNVVASFTGTKNLTFGGLSAGADGSLPTVTDNTGATKNLGTATTITLSNGVSAIGGSLVPHKAEGPVNLTATDGSLSTASTGGTTVSLTVGAATPTKLAFTTQPTNITAGVTMGSFVVQIEDQFSNAVAQAGTTVTLTLNGSTLFSGTNPQTTAANGKATFNDFVIRQAGNGLSFTTANSAGLANATSANFSILPAAASAYVLSAATTTPQAGVADLLTIQLVDQFQNIVTSFSGTKTLTFSGLGAGADGTLPTVSDNTGTARNLGVTTSITFAGGTNSLGGTLIAHKPEGPVNLAVTDGTLSTATAGGAPVSLTVSLGNPSAYRLSAATTTPQAGASDALTLKLVDQYQNVITTFSGDKNLTFAGLSGSAAGNQPTVTDKTGSPVNLGTPTTITFASGLSSAGGSLVAYRAQGPVALTATDGSLSTATTGGTNVTLTVSVTAQSAFRLSATSGTPTAGASDALTIIAADSFGNIVSNYTGSHNLTFSGLGNAPAGNVPTVAGVNLGSATSVTFANGQSSGSVNLIAYKEESANLAVTDGTFSTAGTGGTPASLSVNSAAASAYRLSAATTTPTVGVADQLTISLVDQYQNVVASFTGTKNLTFGGLSAGADGSLPTVTDNTGATKNLGTATTITLSNGVSAIGGSLVPHKAEGPVNLTATDGSLSTASTGGTTVSLTVGAATPTKLAFTTQPTNITAGVTMGSFVVQIEDQFSNAVAQAGTTVTLTLNGSTLFSGTNPQTTAANGKATFNDFVIRQAGNGLSFTTANSAGLANATSANFNIVPAAASAYRLSAATTTPQAGVADLLTIQLVDQYQNIVTNFTGTKNLTFSGLSAGADGTLPTVTDNTGAARNFGTATTITFAGGTNSLGGTLVAHNAEGPVNLAVTDGTLSTATTGGTTVSLTVSVGNASAYRLSAASTNIAAGVSDALTIKLVDQYQNIVTTFSGDKSLTFSGLSASTNGTQPTVTDKTGAAVNLGTATTITFASGQSSAGGVLIAYKVAGPVNLAATDGTLSTSTTGGAPVSLTVSAGAANRLAFTTQPGGGTGGTAWTTQPVVTVQDVGGNTVTTDSSTVTVAIGANPGGGTLSGTLTKAASSGVASFSGLGLKIDKIGTGYTLTATDGALTSATSSSFNITVGSAAKLAFTTQPGGGTGGTAWTTQPVVTVQDAGGNTVTTDSSTVTVAIGTNPGGGTLSGTLTKAASSGVANFSGNGLKIDKIGTGYTLTATDGALTGATSGSFNITTGTATKLAYTTVPSTGTAGTAFSVTVQSQDAGGNPASPTSNTTITLSKATGGGTLSGTLTGTIPTSGNSVTISTPVYSKSDTMTLTATATAGMTGLTAVTSGNIVFSAGAAVKLAFTTQPGGGTGGTAWTTQPVVTVQDANGNTVTTDTSSVTLAIGTNPGGGTLSGTKTVAAVAGLATFSGLNIDKIGTGYTLTATDDALTSATSSGFNITAAAASAITVETAANGSGSVVGVQNVTSGNSITVYAITRDAFGNFVANPSSTWSVTNITGGVVSGDLTPSSGASSTFTGHAVGSAAIAVVNGSLNGNSGTLTVVPAAIAKYAVSAPTTATRGTPFNVTVIAQDTNGNTVTGDNSTVVTMTGSTATVQFDSDGNGTFGDNTKTLSSGTFTISTMDSTLVPETITITATDANGKTGTASVTIAAIGDFRSAATGNWNATATWQTWNGSNWVAATSTPTGAAGVTITIQSAHTVTDNVAVSLLGTLIVNGTLSFTSPGAITVGSGGLIQNAGTISSSTSTLIFNSGGTYQHNQDGGAIPTSTWNSGSTCAVIGYTSTSGNPPNYTTMFSQTFANFTWNCPNQSNAISLGGYLTTVSGDFTVASAGSGSLALGMTRAGDLAIGGNFHQTGGSFYLSSGVSRNVTVTGGFTMTGGTFSFDAAGANNDTFNVYVGGNFSYTGGTIALGSAGTPEVANFVFNGTGTQTYTSGGTFSSAINFSVNSGATLMLGTNLLGNGSSGTFTNSSGATLGIGDPNGITTSGANGNIRVTGARAYSTGANYVFNGAASQVTGSGLPATVSSLTVSNTGGIVSLGASVTVSNNLTVSAGVFDLGSFTANGGTGAGTLNVANAILRIGGTNSFPSNYATHNLGAGSTVNYEGSSQNLSAENYGNLVTSGSGTKTLQSAGPTIAGNLTIGSNTTFAAGSNSFSIAGAFINNGSGFTFAGPQTVTFNGAAVQTLGGSSPTTFDNVAIASGSMLDLAFSGSSTVQALTIAGVQEASGTWGATGSGAAHIDNTHFQGTTGTLNVLSSPTPGIAVATSGSPSTYGQSVTFTATVTGSGPTPTGTVTFNDGANPLGTGTLDGSGHATFATSTLSATSHSITAVYGGDSNYGSSTSTSLTQVVNVQALTITANSTSKAYGQTVTFAGTEFTPSGLVNGDTVTSVTLTSAGAAATATVAGSPYSIIPSSATGTGLANYSISYVNGSLTVNPRTLTVSAVGTNKVYDGTTATTVTLSDDRVSGDNLTTSYTSANFADKTAGVGKTVTVTGITVTGPAATNYTANTTATTTATITPAPATGSITASDKVYDGTTAATISSYSLSGALGTDDVSLAGGTANFADQNVSTGATNDDVAVSSGGRTNVGIFVADTDFAGGGVYATNTVIDTSAVTNPAPQAVYQAERFGNFFSYTFGGFTTARTYMVRLHFAELYWTNVGQRVFSVWINGSQVLSNFDIIADTGAPNKATIKEFPAPVNTNGQIVIEYAAVIDNAKSSAIEIISEKTLVTATGLGLTGADAGNYTLTSDGASTFASITPAPLTVTATSTNKVYGETVAFVGTEFTATGLANGDTVTNVTLTCTGTAATATVAGSPYSIVPSSAMGTGLGNYSISYADGALTVTPQTLTITATNTNKVYGQTITFAGTEFTDSGLVNGDIVTSVTLTCAGAAATASAAGSPYSIIPSSATGTGLGNYSISYADGALTVAAQALTITANSTNKAYGQTVAFVGTEFTATGLANGDTVTNVTLTSAGGTATATVAGSPYSIVPSSATGTGLANYSISYVNGSLTVAGQALTITANSTSKAYGQTVTFAGTEFTPSGLVNGDIVTSVTLTSAGAVATATVAGSPYSIIPSSATGTGLGNYSISYVNGSLTVNPRTLTVSAVGTNKVYDGTTATTVTLSDDRVSGDNLTTSYTSANFADKTAGVGKTVTVTGITVTGPAATNYTANTTATTTATITPAPATGSITASDKVYDGTTAATISSYSLSGALGTDDVSLAGGTANFADQNVSTGATNDDVAVSSGGRTNVGIFVADTNFVGGTAYTTNSVIDISGVTNPAPPAVYQSERFGNFTYTFSGFTTARTYMVRLHFAELYWTNVGQRVFNVLINGAPVLTNFDIIAAAGVPDKATIKEFPATANTNGQIVIQYASVIDNAKSSAIEIISEKTLVTATGLGLAGADAGNYALTSASASTFASITPAPLTVTASQTKVYGAAVPTLTASYIGFVNGEDTNVLSGAPNLSTAATATSPVAGSPYAITVTNGTLSADNYTFAFVSGTLTVTPATVTASVTASDKVYDGTTTATIVSNGLGGVIGTDHVSLTVGSASFSDKNVGSNKTVTATGLGLGSADAGNYNLASPTASTTANITRAALTVTATGVPKTYDATTAATVTLSDNRIGGDVFTDTYTSAVFSDKNVGIAKSISVSGITLSGPDAGNYTPNTTASATATVAPAQVTGSITASNKVYDGTTAAAISTYGLSGVIGSDQVSLGGGSANFNDKNVGNNKTVTATGLTLGGNDAGNYALTSSSATTTANIALASLTVTADNKSRPYAQSNPPLTASYSGFAGGDSTNVLAGAPDLSTTALTNSVVGTYPITVTNGTLSAVNYTFSFVDGTLTIGKAQLAVTADDQSRTYGATNPVLTVTYSGFLNGDDTNVLAGLPDISTTADTNSTVAGSPYTIAVTNGTLTATNYDFAFVSGSLTVTPAVVTVTADNLTNVYGATVPTLTASYTGFVNGEGTNVLSGAPALSTAATATSPVAGSPYTIAVTNGTLNAENYTFTFVDGTLTVTPATLTASVTASDKVYDGTTAAAIVSNVLSGVVGTDNVSLVIGSANFSDKNVASNKTVTATGLTLGGADAGNYTLASGSASTTANITPATLTVTADNQTRAYGAANPAFTASYSGFVNGEVLATSGVTGSPSLTTLATPTSPVSGSPYTITAAVGSLAANNYAFSFLGGLLTVTPADASAAVISSLNPSCAGVAVNFTATVTPSGAGTPTGTVQFKIDGGTFGSPVPLSGTSATSGNISSLTAGGHTITAVYSGDGNFNGTTSPDYTQTVNALPAAPTAGNDGPACVGTTLHLSASTVAGATYSWTGPNGFASTNQNPAISNVTTDAAGAYSVTVTVNGCASATAGTTSVTIDTAPSISGNPAGGTKCAGDTITFSVTASGDGLTYQWRKGGTNIAAAISNSYSIAVLTTNDAGTYDCVVSGTCSPAATSTAAILMVSPTAVAGTATATSTNVCSGSAATITLSGYTGAIQWQSSTDNVVFASISGETNATVTTGPLVVTTYFRAVVTSGPCALATSTVASAIVNTNAPSISAGPVSTNACQNGAATFSVTASGNGPLSYMWRKRGTGWASGWTLNAGGGGLFVSDSTNNNGGDPASNGGNDINTGGRAWGLFNTGGDVTEALRPFGAALAVGETFAIDMDNGSIVSGNSVGFGLQNTSSGANRLRIYAVGGQADYTISDGTGTHDSGVAFTKSGINVLVRLTGSNTYAVTITRYIDSSTRSFAGTLANNGGIDRVRLFDANGQGGNDYDLYFNNLRVGCADDNAADAAYNDGWNGGDNGGQVPLVNGGHIAGATTATLTISPAALADGAYDVCVDDGCGLVTISSAATLTVNSPPSCTVSPATAAICAGGSQTFTVNPTGGTPGYTYLWNTGATTPSITVGTAGTYSVTVTDSNGCTTSCSATLTVNPTPSCTVSPASAAICAGGSQTFTVNPTGGTPGYTYLWNTGATTPNITVGTAGTYSVTVTDSNGCTTTCSATLTVNALPTVFNVTGGGAYCAGGSGVAVGLDGSQSGVSYQLLLGGSPSGAPVAGTGSAISFGDQTGAGTCTVTASNTTTGCTATMNGSATVTVNPLPSTPTASNNGPIIEGNTLNLTASTVNNATYSWTGPNGFASANQNPSISSATSAASGTYLVTVTDSNGCTSAADSTIALVTALRITSITAQGHDIHITWLTTGGTTNALQAVNGNPGYGTNYVDVSSPIIITDSGNTTTNYVDVGGATNTPARFYRVRLVP